MEDDPVLTPGTKEKRWPPRPQSPIAPFSRRSTALLVLSALSIVWGIGLVTSPPVGHVLTLYDVLFSIFTPLAWGCLWIAGGVFVGTVALLRHPKDRAAFGTVSTLFGTWAAGTAIDWLQTGYPRGWVLPVLLGLIALLILVIAGWPE